MSGEYSEKLIGLRIRKFFFVYFIKLNDRILEFSVWGFVWFGIGCKFCGLFVIMLVG